MTAKQEAQIKKLGIFSLKEASALGLDQPTISRLVKAGRINRVGRGLYLHPKASVSKEVGFQIACAKFGHQAVIGGLSALFHYNLIEQVPGQTWVLVPPGKLSKEKGYRLIRTKANLNVEILAKDKCLYWSASTFFCTASAASPSLPGSSTVPDGLTINEHVIDAGGVGRIIARFDWHLMFLLTFVMVVTPTSILVPDTLLFSIVFSDI